MVPSSLAALAAFLLLVAPGLLTDLLAARRKTGAPESTFRELSRTVFASLFFTLIAGVLVAALAFKITGATWPEVIEVMSKRKFPPEHRFALAILSLSTSILACILALLYHLIRFWGNTSRIKPVSTWYQVFHQEIYKKEPKRPGKLPPLTPFVRIRLSDGYTYMGSLSGYTQQLELEDREIILGQPLWVTPPNKKRVRIGASWQRMVFRGENIISVSVRYDPVTSAPDKSSEQTKVAAPPVQQPNLQDPQG